jgi:hypothetical protein
MGSDNYDRIPIALVALLTGFLVAGVAAARFTPPNAEAQPSLPDLSSAHFVEVRNASGRTVLSGEFREREDPLGNMEKDAALVDRRGRRVIGEIEIEVPGPNAIHSTQELEIDIIEIDPNAKYSVFVDDREVTTFTTDDRGSIDLELNSAMPTTDRSR